MANNIPTPHISAKEGEIAPSILLPGDPLRAKYIAENFLAGAKQFNSTRNMFGYTGFYPGISPFPSWEPAWAARPWASIPTS